MAARARVLMDPRAPSLRRLQDRLSGDQFVGTAAMSFDGRLAVLYAGALAASSLNESAAAETALAKAFEMLRGKTPALPTAERSFALLNAEVLLQRGDAARAVKILDTPALQPPSRAAMLLRASASLALWRSDAAAANADLRRSVETLQTWVSLHGQDATAWDLLGQCAEAAGQRLRGIRAQAEARAALGDISGAIERLRAAQALVRSGAANDFIEASVVDARLRQLEAERRQLAAEMRKRLALGHAAH
jgi:predicted Zn-dependent protease